MIGLNPQETPPNLESLLFTAWWATQHRFVDLSS